MMKTADLVKTPHRTDEAAKARAKILVVEDNAKNRKLIRCLLEINGIDAIEASDAETGIQMAQRHQPDLILMDIQLPGMDGLAATRILKDTPDLKSINIVALTSYAMAGDSQKAEAAGCDGYLTKPIDTRSFMDNIRPFLRTPDVADSPSPAKDGDALPTLLIVDDEPRNLKLLRATLSRHYPRIEEARDGTEALEKANSIVPDIILLDIMMPGIDGFEVTRRLKSSSRTRHIPVVLVTALDGHNYKVMGYEAGADEFLNKPINAFELVARLKSLLELKKAQDTVSRETVGGTDTAAVDSDGLSLQYANPKIRILIKDQEHLKKIKMYLFGQGYDICVIENLSRIGEMLLKDRPDLLIIDDQLKQEPYRALFSGTKTAPGGSSWQVLYVTREEHLEEAFKQVEEMVDDFLIQPINIYELRARIRVLMKKKRFLDQLIQGQGKSMQHVIVDAATGLYNFEYCMHVLKHEIQRSARGEHPVALVLMGLNGIPDGDNGDGNGVGPFLSQFGSCLKETIRRVDIGARRAERTFAFVLPDANTEKTKGFIQRLKGVLSRSCLLGDSESAVERGLLFGYAVCPDNSSAPDEILATAEGALREEFLRVADLDSRGTNEEVVRS